MYFKNKNSLLNTKYKLLELSDFSSGFDYDNAKSNSNIAKLCVNFNSENNCLTASYGEEDFNCYIASDTEAKVYPDIDNLNVVDMKYFLSNQAKNSKPRKQLMVVTDEYKIYTTILDDGSTSYLKVMDLPSSCSYRLLHYCFESTNYMIISTKTTLGCSNYIYSGHGELPKDIACNSFIYDICCHNDKMFVVLEEDYRNKVFFGEDLNPFNINKSLLEMKTVRIPAGKGKILKMLSLGSYLYVFCEFGIYRIILYSNQDKYYLEEVYTGNAKTIEDTIVMAGDNIMFSDEEGVFIFNGNSIAKVDLKFDNLFKSKRKYMSVACFNDNKYYLSTNLNYSDGIVESYDNFRNNALIIYDVVNKKVELCCGLSIRKIVVYGDAYKGRVAILSGHMGLAKLRTLSDNSGRCSGIISKKIWCSCDYDFNDSVSRKILRHVNIKTKEDVQLELNLDGKKILYNIVGSDERQRIVINKKANIFSFKIICFSESPCIEFVKILVGIYE